MEQWRLFIAVELSAEVRRWITDQRNRLEPRMPSGAVRWVQPDGIHLTLIFLGETPSGRMDEIRKGMALATAVFPPFSLAVSDLGCFPNIARPRVVWTGLQPSPDLMNLQLRLEDELAATGFPREQRAFSPHLTLGRVRDGIAVDELRQIGSAVKGSGATEGIHMEVKEVCLFRSILQPSGAEYTRLHTAPLNG
jgi:2'-5' RNA ligase